MDLALDTSIAAQPTGAKRPVVLQVLPELATGGVERGTVDLAKALIAAGGQALVASAGGAMVRELERAGATHIALPLASKNPFVIWQNADRLARAIDDHGVEIVHARSRAPAWSARAAARRCHVPFVTTVHGVYNVGWAGKRLYNSVMTKGDRVIAISRFVAEHIRLFYGTDPARIATIPRGIDLARFDPQRVMAQRIVALTQAWRIGDGLPVILLPGRLTRWKGQMVMVEAMAFLVEILGHRNLMCLLVGSDQGRSGYRNELESAIDRRGLGGVVRLVGHCNDMPAAYMLADIVVSASTDPEAFGRVAAEAQAMGRPVIATDHGGARETVLAGRTGWLVPPGNAVALAEALRSALALDAAGRQSLAQAARAHIAEIFTVERMCAATLAVYGELLAAAATRAA